MITHVQMNRRTKELIAIGASVAAHCRPCLTYHVARAKEAGIGKKDISEAIAVGHMVEKGAMSAMRQYSTEVVDTPAGAEAGCCGESKAKGKNCCG